MPSNGCLKISFERYGAEDTLVESGHQWTERIAADYGLHKHEFYLMQNGKRVLGDGVISRHVTLHVIPRVLGGKGGFGSMLRAIGAQIEKTTNRDACRDLSGRRLRDINEEQRLKRWFAKQAEREKEREENRQKKLEKLRQIQEGPPLPKMEDTGYNQQRADMSDAVFEAVDKGFEASKQKRAETVTSGEEESTSASSAEEAGTSGQSSRISESSKIVAPVAPQKKKLKKLMLDEDFDTDSSSDEESGTAVATS